MHISLRTGAWLLILVLFVPGFVFAEQRAKLEGRIVDPQGNGIQGVKVTATCEQDPKFKETRTTDKKGTFTISFSLINVTYHYRFEKEGYQTLDANQNWSAEGSHRFDWTMQPGTGQAQEPNAPPPASTSAEAVSAYNAGVVAVRSKDYATAEAKFKESVGYDPKLVQAWMALSSAQFQAKHFKDSAESAEKAVALGSHDEALLTTRYQAYKNAGDDTNAAAALKDLEAFGRRTEEAKKVHNEAVALVKAGSDEAAFAKFQEALTLDPTLEPSLVGLATAGLKLGHNGEAATAAEAILKKDPGNEAALRLRYNACLALGDTARLADALVGIYAVDPAVAKNGLLKLGVDAYYDANNQEHGRAALLKVLEWDPNQPYANYYIALIYVSEGKNAEAKTHLAKVVAAAPNTPQGVSARDMLKQLENIK